jgi:hypothetical protein
MTRKTDLQVNGNKINLDRFVDSFVHHTVTGMIDSLEGTREINGITLSIDGETVKLELNGQPVATNLFVNKIITSTVAGMVSPLKGVKGPLVTARIHIEE